MIWFGDMPKKPTNAAPAAKKKPGTARPMGRPLAGDEPAVTLAIRVSPQLLASLDAMVKKLNATSFGRVTRSSLAQRLLARALVELPPQKEEP